MNYFDDDESQNISKVGQFLSSPAMAAANAAVGRIDARRMGQQPSPISPAQAYQQQIVARATAGQQRKINDLTIQQKEQNLDKFYDYKQAISQGIIPKEMSYAEFEQLGLRPGTSDTSNIRDHNYWMQQNPKPVDGTPEEIAEWEELSRSTFNQQLRAPTMWTDPGGGQYRTGIAGTNTLLGTKDATEMGANRAGAESRASTSERLIAEQDGEFRTAAQSLPEFEQMIQDTKDLLEQVRSGEFTRTGFFEGRVARFTDEKTAKLAAKQVMQTLRNLQITNLAPVTENEIRLIEDLYASVLKDPAANIGSLEAAIEEMEKRVQLIDKMGQYWTDNDGTLRDYQIINRWKKKGDIDLSGVPE